MATRRTFLKGLTATSATALLGPGLLVSGMKTQEAAAASVSAEGTWKTAGSHWGAIKALVKGGKVVEVRPFEEDRNPTDMYKGIHGLIYNPSRIRYPMARVGWLKNRKDSDRSQRGDNRFVRLTWDEALDLFYEELERVQTDYGPWALYAGATGWRQTGQFHSCTNHMNRAVGMHGNFVRKVGVYSTGAGQTILPYVLGSTEVYSQGTSWPLILEHSKTFVFWASDPIGALSRPWSRAARWLRSGHLKKTAIPPICTRASTA